MLHIHWTEPHEDVFRNPYGDRWCFSCRKRVAFEYVCKTTVQPSFYPPIEQIECTRCKTVDGDVFPGRERMWK